METIQTLLRYGIKELKSSGIVSAALDAEILLSFVLGKDKKFQIANFRLHIDDKKTRRFKSLIARRKKHEPIAHIIGHKEFYGIDFFVTKDVLVPRPETELIVELVLDKIKNEKIKMKNYGIRHRWMAIVDIGTGSGCIGLTLAKHLPEAKVICADISKKALSIARKNRKRLQQSNKIARYQVRFVLSDLLEKIKVKPDIIVANLPYLTKEELKEPSISKEPHLALYGGKDGLALYEKLFQQLTGTDLQGRGSPRPWRSVQTVQKPTFFLEIGENQGKKITALARRYFPKAKVEIRKDLAKKDRVMIVQIS